MKGLVFGPVPSRRLGLSLGVDLFPGKYCSFDCIYCQVGKTTETTVERACFFETGEVVEQVLKAVRSAPRVNFITLSGSGEPTLSSNLGQIIRALKKRTRVPLAVITNASLFALSEVREELRPADVVLPSLDAAREETFQAINRPHPTLSFSGLIAGIKAFRRDFKGQIWLEIMLIRNINNDQEHIDLLSTNALKLDADKIQLNTITRPPCERGAEGMGSLELQRACALFGNRCEVIGAFEGRLQSAHGEDWQEAVEAILKRRSLSLEEIAALAGLPLDMTREKLQELEARGRVTPVLVEEKLFYVAGRKGTNSVDKEKP